MKDAFDPYTLPDQHRLAMSVMASCFAVLLCTLEESLSVPVDDRRKVFRKSLDKSMERIYNEAKHVDSTAEPQAQQWAFARLEMMSWIRHQVKEIQDPAYRD